MSFPSAGAVVTLGAVAALALPVPAQAAGERCDDPSGVTVVVDPGPLGDEPRVGCASGSAGESAAEAVRDAGFEVTYAQGQPFVCRIDDRPGPEREQCVRTPPQDAYWALFWSDGESTWTYSSLGLAALDVPPGGSVGFRFQDGGEREDPTLPPNGAETDGSTSGEQPTAPPRAQQPADPITGRALAWTAGGAVVALGAAAGLIAWRRRS